MSLTRNLADLAAAKALAVPVTPVPAPGTHPDAELMAEIISLAAARASRTRPQDAAAVDPEKVRTFQLMAQIRRNLGIEGRQGCSGYIVVKMPEHSRPIPSAPGVPQR